MSMGQITLVYGSANSERAAAIDALWQKYSDSAMLLVPTSHLARKRQNDFVRQYKPEGLLGKHAWELTDFTRAIVEQNGQPVYRLSTLERRLMVHKALAALPPEITSDLPITPGLVRHLLRIITELKQAAIEPHIFRETITNSKHQGSFDTLVATVYEHYQNTLLAEGRYDVPGLYWEAERCCKEQKPSLPNNASILLLDGFDDFTPSQTRFLAALAAHVERLVIGLHYDPDPDRSDLFQLQKRWIDTFNAQTATASQTYETTPPKDYIRHITHHLFWRNPPPSPAGLTANVRLLPCADVQHEIETIARQIKQLLIQHKTQPRQIAFCLTDVESHIGALRAIFKGFGIPLTMRVYPSLLSTSVGAFVMRLFEALNTWERRTITSLLASPLLGATPKEKSLVKIFPLFSRHLGVLMGQQEFRDRLHNTSEPKEFQKLSLNYEKTKQLFIKRFDRLEDLEKALPKEASINIFAKVLDEQLGNFLTPNTLTDNIESAALRALHSLLEQLVGETNQDTLINRVAFVRILEETLSETSVFVKETKDQGVCCCNMEGLRHEQFAYVFLGGLNESLLPRPLASNAVYSEAELSRLHQLHLHLPGSYEHTYHQRLLFYHAVNAAQQELTLSWRKQDTKGRETLPSPFIVDIEDMFKDHCLDIVHPDPGPDCFIPEPFLAASPRDLATVACHRHWEPLLECIPKQNALKTTHAISVDSRRNNTRPFDEYDGCIAASDLKAVIAAAYGADTQFSVDQLEKYLRFPFAFFMENILRIRETETPENELDPRTRGSILHDALYRFHKHFVGIPAIALLEQEHYHAQDVMKECIHEAFRKFASALASVPDTILHVEQRRLEITLQRYLVRMADDFDNTLPPQYFEAVFGRAPRNAAEDLYKDSPFPLIINDETVYLTGKIDRIDTDGETLRLIDYKTSSTPATKQIKEGLDLQLSVYAWAAQQHLLPGTTCAEAWYYPIFNDKKQDALLRKKEVDFADRETNAKEHITKAVHGIRSGYFPPVPAPSLDADRLHISTAARYEEWRIERKNIQK